MCFKSIKTPTFYSVLQNNSCLCELCLNKLIPKFSKFDVDGYDGLAIYDYDDNIKAVLYQFKGCYDIELSDVFLYRYSRELSLLYKGYIMVPVPSYYTEDDAREFNHVEEMFKILNLNMCKCIKKITPFKQAEHTKKERGKIIKHLSSENLDSIRGKKVLIVDDVMTTGSTLKAMISLLKQGQPKTIKILVMSRRVMS